MHRHARMHTDLPPYAIIHSPSDSYYVISKSWFLNSSSLVFFAWWFLNHSSSTIQNYAFSTHCRAHVTSPCLYPYRLTSISHSCKLGIYLPVHYDYSAELLQEIIDKDSTQRCNNSERTVENVRGQDKLNAYLISYFLFLSDNVIYDLFIVCLPSIPTFHQNVAPLMLT